MQWTGHLIGVILSIIVAFIPTGIYGTLWWFIPKTFWPIFVSAIGGVVWLVVQVIWALFVGLWWDKSSTSHEEYKNDSEDWNAHSLGGDGLR